MQLNSFFEKQHVKNPEVPDSQREAAGYVTAQSIVGTSKGRSKHDFYPTPAFATESLLEKEQFSGTILEPACGDGAISKILESNGFSVVRDLCGHGVGKHLHEDPQINNFGKKNSGTVIKNGMTLAIEPMVNIGTYKVTVADDNWTVLTADNLASAHFEHTIAIIDGKPEILTII